MNVDAAPTPKRFGLLATQGLSVLNDYTVKQIILLWMVQRSSSHGDWQGVALVVFAAPFLIFAWPAGRCSDLIDRRRIILIAKYAEIPLMMMVGWVVDSSADGSMIMVLGLLFGIASVATFLGPAKYGIVLDCYGRQQVIGINAAMQTLAYLAIVVGSAAGGWFISMGTSPVPWIAIALTSVGILGACTAHQIPLDDRSPADSELANRKSANDEAAENKSPVDGHSIRNHRLLCETLLMYGMIWCVAGLYQPIINSVGQTQMHLSAFATSVMISISVVGIAIGCGISGWRSAGQTTLVPFTWIVAGMVLTQGLLAIPSQIGFPLSPQWVAGNLFLAGVFIGLAILPLHVTIQVLAPKAIRGRVLAIQNVVNWVAIIVAGIVYQVFRIIADRYGLSPSAMFLPLAILTMSGWIALVVRKP